MIPNLETVTEKRVGGRQVNIDKNMFYLGILPNYKDK